MSSAFVQRFAVIVAVVLSPFVVGPPEAIDGITIGKAVVVVLAGAVVLAAGVVASSRSRVLVIARDPAVIAAGLVLAGLIIATVLSPDPALAMSGDLPRWNGFALYAACVVLFVTAATRYDRRTARQAIRPVVVAAGLMGALAVVEIVGIHDFGGAAVSGARATLANPNFLAGWLAIALPICVSTALHSGFDPLWRRISVGAASVGVLGILASGSLQGPVAAAAGTAVVALVWIAAHRPVGQVRVANVGAAALAVLFLGVGVLGTQGAGPAAALEDQVGVTQRGYYWRAAVSMTREAPVTGVGPGHFEENYRRHRPIEDALANPLEHSADSAHSVPLDMAASGGLPLVAAYVGWLGLVGWRLWRGLRSMEGGGKLLLSGIGGAWVAYVAQSIVSIDVPPLAVMGWVLGGLVIAVGGRGAQWRIRLPWLRAGEVDKPESTSVPTWVAGTAAVALTLVVAWFALLPLRADAGAIQGELTPTGNLDPGSGVVQAARIADWDSAFGMQLVRAYIVTGDHVAAQDAATALVERRPESFDPALSAARLAAENGDLDVATRMYRHTTVLEPFHPAVLLEAAEHAKRVGEGDWARSLVDRVLSADPDHPGAAALAARL